MSNGNPTLDGSHPGASVARSVDSASVGMHRAINRASDAARPAVDNLASGAHHTVDRIASMANRAAASVEATGGQICNAQSRVMDSCRIQLRDQPLTTLGIAVAVGYFLNWATRKS